MPLKPEGLLKISYAVITADNFDEKWKNPKTRNALVNQKKEMGKAFTKKAIKSGYKDSSHVYALHKDKIVGSIMFKVLPERVVQTHRTITSDKYQERGIASRLTLHLIGWMRSHGLTHLERKVVVPKIKQLHEKMDRGTGKGPIDRSKKPEHTIIGEVSPDVTVRLKQRPYRRARKRPSNPTRKISHRK
jgi:predicted GNAT family acetyltransferase